MCFWLSSCSCPDPHLSGYQSLVTYTHTYTHTTEHVALGKNSNSRKFRFETLWISVVVRRMWISKCQTIIQLTVYEPISPILHSLIKIIILMPASVCFTLANTTCFTRLIISRIWCLWRRVLQQSSVNYLWTGGSVLSKRNIKVYERTGVRVCVWERDKHRDVWVFAWCLEGVVELKYMWGRVSFLCRGLT